MNDTDKIIKILEEMQTDISGLKTDTAHIHSQVDKQGETLETHGKKLDNITYEQGHVRSILKVLPTMHDLDTYIDAAKNELKADISNLDAAVNAAKNELKADILNLDAKVIRKLQSHQRRITNIEDHDGIENPDKN